jgi:hypothetical protein
VFDQNHFNLVIIELFIFALILLLGIFKDYPAFQLPAAASFMIFVTVFVMLSGAFSYWFGNWSATTALVIFLIVNFLFGKDFFSKKYEAFGLDYHKPPAEYTVAALKKLNTDSIISMDKDSTMVMLKNWRNKFPAVLRNPKWFFCV